MKKQKQAPAALLRYCVGIDVGKDTLHLCVSVIDADGRVSVKGSRQFPNRVPAFEVLEAWCAKHHKDMALPVRYLMESTGVYHEQIAWHLFRADRQTSVVLPNKAKHYLMSLGHKSKNDKIDARGLAQMGLEQNLPLWQPLSKEIYTLRMLTRQHQRLQELKNQSQNQQHAIMHSQIVDPFIIKQLNVLIKLYDKQVEQIGEQIEKLLAKDAVLKAKIEQLCQIKGLGLLSVATIVAETNGFEGFDRTGAPECPPARELRRIRRRGEPVWPTRRQDPNIQERQQPSQADALPACLQRRQVRRTVLRGPFRSGLRTQPDKNEGLCGRSEEAAHALLRHLEERDRL